MKTCHVRTWADTFIIFSKSSLTISITFRLIQFNRQKSTEENKPSTLMLGLPSIEEEPQLEEAASSKTIQTLRPQTGWYSSHECANFQDWLKTHAHAQNKRLSHHFGGDFGVKSFASGFLLHQNVWKVKINCLFILWKAVPIFGFGHPKSHFLV